MNPTNTAALALHGLQKSFGPIRAVDGVSLTLAPGEVVAFLGPNGAGKSTTLDMVLGLTQPDAGTVSVFGRPPREAVRDSLVGAMLQTGALLPNVTVGELVRAYAALHLRHLPVGTVLERAGIGGLARQKTTSLSGGQAQRVRYALALVPDPDLMVLDEPTVAMDVETRRSFWASMRDFTSTGRTVLFATHYLEEADAFADRVIVLSQGRVVADGTGAAIKSHVSGRTIVVTIPAVEPGDLRMLPGVATVTSSGSRWSLHCTDSDTTLHALLDRYPAAHDIEVAAADLEDAFLQLTATAQGDRR